MSRGTKHPAVSFIVPNYNYGHFLGECLESAVRQTFEDWEIVIIDDSSTDCSLDVARDFVAKYPKKIRLIELHDGPGGPPRAINTGIRAMRGRYFSWLSSDDRCAPDRLQKLVAMMESNPGAGMVHTAYRLIDNDGTETGITVPEDYPGAEAFFRLLEGNIINGSTVLVRRELLDEIGPLLETDSEFPDLLRVSEYLLWLDISLRTDVALVREPLHDYRIHTLNAEYNRSTLGKTLVRIGKRHFLKKHGLRNVVSWLCTRSGAPRSQVYARIASILLHDADTGNISLLLGALAGEGTAEIQAVQSVAHDLQRRKNYEEIVEFYLATNNAVTRDVLRTFTEPSPALERLTLKLLNNAKAEFNSDNFVKAARDLQDLLLVTPFFKPLDISARYYLGLSLNQLGDESAAICELEAVLRLDPSHRKAAQELNCQASRHRLSKV